MPRHRFAPVAAALALLPALASAQHAHFPIPIPGQNRAATPFELAIGRGDQALRREAYADAAREFQTAARLNPRDARPEFYLGEVAMRQSQWPEAEQHFRAALRLNPQMAEAHADLGAVLREQGHGADAIASLETATRLDPQLPEPHLTLGLALEDAGQGERALTEYRAAARLAPDDPMAALNLGILLANGHPAAGSQPRAEAFRMLQSAVQHGGSDRAVLVSAGPALRMIGEPGRAAEVLERARAMGNPSASLLGELSQALWAAGDHPRALARIGEAVGLEPRSAELHYVRALMLAEQGDRAGATRDLREVSQLAAGTPLAARAQQHLQQLGGGHGGPAAHAH